MSTAHRPTFDTAAGKADTRASSRVYSSRDMAAHTKLKFRKPGQGSRDDVRKRDLRADLLLAEAEAVDRKRKKAGLAPLLSLPSSSAPTQTPLTITASEGGGMEGGQGEVVGQGEDEEAVRRRQRLRELAALEDDDDEEEEEEEGQAEEDEGKKVDKGKGKGRSEEVEGEQKESDDEEDDEEDDDDDDTADLMRELARIRQERAEEKARIEAEQNEAGQIERDEATARGNPLLNLANALGMETPSSRLSTPSSAAGFAVKRRWDDDLVFKNQAVQANREVAPTFVNDLLRTDFHRSFLKRFIA